MAKRGTLEHPKNKRLARRLGVQQWASLGLLESFWQWVSRYRPTGFLTSDDIADCCDTIGFGGDLVDMLLPCGWLDEMEGGWYVHDWHDHADDTTKKTLAKRHESFANGSNIRREKAPNTPEPIREPFANDERIIRDKPEPEPKPQPEPPGPAAGFVIPSPGDCEAFAVRNGGTTEDGARFWRDMDEQGWHTLNGPVKNWRGLLKSWVNPRSKPPGEPPPEPLRYVWKDIPGSDDGNGRPVKGRFKPGTDEPYEEAA